MAEGQNEDFSVLELLGGTEKDSEVFAFLQFCAVLCPKITTAIVLLYDRF